MNLMGGLPPSGKARIIGGLLGVAGAEAWQGARGGFEQGGLVTRAMVDLCRAYVGVSGPSVLEVACRYEGVPAPGWLLPVAIMRHRKSAVVSDTLELAIAAGVPRAALPACVAYVELAWELFAGRPVDAAVLAATGNPLAPPLSAAPVLCGMAPVDALTTGVWALGQQGRLCDLAASLAYHVEPWVAAPAAGLLGLRDGCIAVPAQWHKAVVAADACIALAHRLVTARGRDVETRHLAVAS